MKEKLADKVITQISGDIQNGTFKVGDKIPAEPELMKRYEVGRSTIREAIKSLSNSGMLKVQQGFGTVVNTAADTETFAQRLKRADFEDINAVRILLESEMVKLAAEKRSAAQLADLSLCLQNRKIAIQSEQRQACADADIAFHMAVASASQNTVLADLYQNFTSLIRDFFSKREPRGISHFAMSHHLHEQLFNSIKAQDANHAQQIIKEILNNNY